MTDMMDISHMEPNPWNPNKMDAETREMLSENLQAEKYDPLIITPKYVFYEDPELPKDRYIITDGGQRWDVASELGLSQLKVDIQPMTEAEARKECYSRSRVRGQLDPFKEGEFFNLEVEALGSETAVAKEHGVSRSYVASRRSLVKIADPVKRLLGDTEKAFVELKKEEIAADITRNNPEETYTNSQMTEMVEASIEMGEYRIAPRGTLTPSHLEVLTSLEDAQQQEVATKVLEDNLSVRATETFVKKLKEKIARKSRFEAALERALTKKCPVPNCGGYPKDFEEGYGYVDGEHVSRFNEDKFECNKSSWHDWDYMEDPTKRERRQKKQEKEAKESRSSQLSEANLNPGYTRRAEDKDTLLDSMRPWVLRKLLQLTTVERVAVTGIRDDGKMVRITFPSTFGSGISIEIGDAPKTKGGWMDNRKPFTFGIENKNYKKLPFKSKLDTKATPESRTLVHHFLDHIIQGDGDPVLPEDPEEVKALMGKYGELKEESKPQEEHRAPTPEEIEAMTLEDEPLDKVLTGFDMILDSFLEGDHDLVKVDVEDFDAEDIEGYLDLRIIARAITGNVEVYEGEDGGVYLERLESQVDIEPMSIEVEAAGEES